jgi:hypothetical protein
MCMYAFYMHQSSTSSPRWRDVDAGVPRLWSWRTMAVPMHRNLVEGIVLQLPSTRPGCSRKTPDLGLSDRMTTLVFGADIG